MTEQSVIEEVHLESGLGRVFLDGKLLNDASWRSGRPTNRLAEGVSAWR